MEYFESWNSKWSWTQTYVYDYVVCIYAIYWYVLYDIWCLVWATMRIAWVASQWKLTLKVANTLTHTHTHSDDKDEELSSAWEYSPSPSHSPPVPAPLARHPRSSALRHKQTNCTFGKIKLVVWFLKALANAFIV